MLGSPWFLKFLHSCSDIARGYCLGTSNLQTMMLLSSAHVCTLVVDHCHMHTLVVVVKWRLLLPGLRSFPLPHESLFIQNLFQYVRRGHWRAWRGFLRSASRNGNPCVTSWCQSALQQRVLELTVQTTSLPGPTVGVPPPISGSPIRRAVNSSYPMDSNIQFPSTDITSTKSLRIHAVSDWGFWGLSSWQLVKYLHDIRVYEIHHVLPLPHFRDDVIFLIIVAQQIMF